MNTLEIRNIYNTYVVNIYYKIAKRRIVSIIVPKDRTLGITDCPRTRAVKDLTLDIYVK